MTQQELESLLLSQAQYFLPEYSIDIFPDPDDELVRYVCICDVDDRDKNKIKDKIWEVIEFFETAEICYIPYLVSHQDTVKFYPTRQKRIK